MDITRRLLLSLVLASSLTCPAPAQNQTAKPRYFPPYAVSSPVRQIVIALGDRVQRPGSERLIMTGSLNRQGAISDIQVIRELPGYLRVDDRGGKDKTLVFDLTSLKGSAAIDDGDEALAETLESDTPEAFLGRLGPGASMRHLGDRFRVKGETGFGSQVDIYEVVSVVALKRDKQAVTKRYMFDSTSGLLRRVVYAVKSSGSTVLVQTVVANYSVAAGYTLPGRIARMVNGVEVLFFTRTGASVTPAQPDGIFASVGR